jgi:DNA replication protein DnaC
MNSNHATVRKLEAMGLHGMARAFKSTMAAATGSSFTTDELISYLVDTEWDDRNNRKIARLIKAARFRFPACFEQIDFSLPRDLDKNQLLRLSDCGWIERHENILITGPTGVGKSFVVQALGHQGCLYGHKTGYHPCSRLFKQLKLARADGSYLKEMTRLAKLELLIIDDLGLEPFDAPGRLSLLEILEERIGRKSIVVVSQVPVGSWHEVIGDPTIADAICDRIVHSAHRIELAGESARKLYAQRQKDAEKDLQ